MEVLMLCSFPSVRTITKALSIAVILTASWVGAGTAVQAGQPTLTFKNSAKVKISIKVDKMGYREDIPPGGSVTVPAAKLQNTDPKDTGIDWDALQADLKSVQQKSPNPVCDSGKIKFDANGAAVITVKGTC
jgi:hypothetical protein